MELEFTFIPLARASRATWACHIGLGMLTLHLFFVCLHLFVSAGPYLPYFASLVLDPSKALLYSSRGSISAWLPSMLYFSSKGGPVG